VDSGIVPIIPPRSVESGIVPIIPPRPETHCFCCLTNWSAAHCSQCLHYPP
jgi:hypothetical protein